MSRFPKDSNPKLTDETIKTIVQAIRLGSYVETAVALAGVSKDTFYRWIKKAQSDDANSLTVKLSDAVKKAMAESEMRDLDVIDQAAQGGVWQAAAWRLERKHPQRWGRQATLSLEYQNEGESKLRDVVDLTKLSTTELLALERAVSDDSEPES